MASIVKPGKGVVKPIAPLEVEVPPPLKELDEIQMVERRTDKTARVPRLSRLEIFQHRNGQLKKVA